MAIFVPYCSVTIVNTVCTVFEIIRVLVERCSGSSESCWNKSRCSSLVRQGTQCRRYTSVQAKPTDVARVERSSLCNRGKAIVCFAWLLDWLFAVIIFCPFLLFFLRVTLIGVYRLSLNRHSLQVNVCDIAKFEYIFFIMHTCWHVLKAHIATFEEKKSYSVYFSIVFH